jgi:hypothetical protein
MYKDRSNLELPPKKSERATKRRNGQLSRHYTVSRIIGVNRAG